MNRFEYYDDLKRLARQVRKENGLTTPRVTASDMRRIYFRNGIQIDFWPYKLRHLRGAFISDELGTSVMLARNLPQDPLVFTMAHELKHFYCDRNLGFSYCDESNISKIVEVGAEIFAAELIFTDHDFIRELRRMRIGTNQCRPEDLVELKRVTQTTLSYAGLAIKAERLRFAKADSLTYVKTWRALERRHGVRR